MRNISIVQLGLGGVGSPLIRQFLDLSTDMRGGLVMVAVADSSGALVSEAGLGADALAGAMAAKGEGRPLASLAGARDTAALHDLVAAHPTIVVDATASDATMPLLRRAADSSNGIVLANKRPACAPLPDWRELNAGGRLRYEATVGAGLPVISTLEYLQVTGDRVTSVDGALSGTLGFLFSRMEAGDSFSTALRLAYDRRYTEPDPRDDLGGMDVARKGLILARTIGLDLELSDIPVQSLYPREMASLSVPDFLEQAKSLDEQYLEQQRQAQEQGMVMRYLAHVEPGVVRIGLTAVPSDSSFGALRGADNLISIATERYTSPIRIAGPGAGTAVTAAGVLADILSLATAMRASGAHR